MASATGTGAVSGAASGAALGTQIMPGWGTAIGAVAGGAIGALGGSAAGKKAEAQKRRAAEQYAQETGAVSQAQAAPVNQLQATDPNSPTAILARQRLAMGAPMSPEEIAISLRNDQVQAQQKQLSGQVNAFFDDPNRQAAQQQTVQQQLQANLGGIGDQYRQDYVGAAQRAGGQGLLGSSVDIEGRAAAGAQRDASAAQASAQAQQQAQGMANQNTAQRQQLLQLVNSQDPAQAQSANAQLQALNAQAGGISAQTGVQNQGRQLQQFGTNNQSQAWGGAINNVGSMIQGNPQLGGSLSAWLGKSQTHGGTGGG